TTGILLALAFAAGAYWFLTAPDIRFAGPLFWLVFAATLRDAVTSIALPRPAPAVVAGVVALLAAYPLASIKPPALQLASLSPEPRPPAATYLTRSGLEVLLPADGDCWDLPPPCTMFKLPGLRLREPGKLESGFAGDAWESFDPGPHPPMWWD